MGCCWQSDRILNPFSCVFLVGAECGSWGGEWGWVQSSFQAGKFKWGQGVTPECSCLFASLTNLSLSLCLGHTPAQAITLVTSYCLHVRVPPVFKASLMACFLPSPSTCELTLVGKQPLRPSSDWQALPTGLIRAASPLSSSSHSLICNSAL